MIEQVCFYFSTTEMFIYRRVVFPMRKRILKTPRKETPNLGISYSNNDFCNSSYSRYFFFTRTNNLYMK